MNRRIPLPWLRTESPICRHRQQQVGPIATEARGLTSDARGLTQETSRELRRTGEVLDQVHEAASGVVRIVNALAKFTRAGQIVGLATGLRRGVDVFVERLRKNGGNHGH